MLPTALALAVSIPLANAAGFEVELQPDIVQRRDVVDPGNQVVELVRILPPDEEPWTLIVHVPNSWVDASRGADRTPALVSSASGAQTRALVQAVMRDVSGASSLSGMQAAGLWAGLLRCSSFASPVPVSHYDTVLEPWEVLYDAQAGDTLSSSLSALMALEQLGVAARLARYPTPATSSGVAFGLAIDGQAPAKADWAWPVQGADPPAVVLPLHLKAKPQGDLAIDQLHSWTLQMVLGADWSPGVEPTTDALTDPNPNPDPDPDPDPKSDPDPDPDPAPAPPPAPHAPPRQLHPGRGHGPGQPSGGPQQRPPLHRPRHPRLGRCRRGRHRLPGGPQPSPGPSAAA